MNGDLTTPHAPQIHISRRGSINITMPTASGSNDTPTSPHLSTFNSTDDGWKIGKDSFNSSSSSTQQFMSSSTYAPLSPAGLAHHGGGLTRGLTRGADDAASLTAAAAADEYSIYSTSSSRYAPPALPPPLLIHPPSPAAHPTTTTTSSLTTSSPTTSSPTTLDTNPIVSVRNFLRLCLCSAILYVHVLDSSFFF